MIEYHPDLDVQVAFPPLACLEDGLCEVVSQAGLRQVKVAESEKAIHVSFFDHKRRISCPAKSGSPSPHPTALPRPRCRPR